MLKRCNHNLKEIEGEKPTIYECVYCGDKFTTANIIAKTEDTENRNIVLIRGVDKDGSKKKKED